MNINKKKINYEIFNTEEKNQTTIQLAKDVKKVMGRDIKIIKVESSDKRSYRISSEKIFKVLKFKTKYTIKDLKEAFQKKTF
tara:strand:+ start:221 stop:466 length:246 start_codon:yes stop_codon:yes gene_type:complete